MSGEATPLAVRARGTVEEHSMLPDGCVVVAMVSGGADSVALLRLLAAGGLGTHRLSALHLDHGLRDESGEDASWVGALCERLGIPLRVERMDVGGYAREQGLNVEDAGRRLRYALADEELDARCGEAGVDPRRGRIAVAHTLDDRIETFVMRALTGAGTGGLTGLRPVRGRVVRPLADASRAQVVEHLAAIGQEWREDPSNLDTTRLRARVRHTVLPALAQAAPDWREHFARTLRVLTEEEDLLGGMAAAFARDFAAVEPDGTLLFDRAMMSTLTRPVARRTVLHAVRGAFPEASRIEASHIEALVDGLADDGFARDVTGGLHARTEAEALAVRRVGAAGFRVEPGSLALPGEVSLGSAGRMTARPWPPGEVPRDPDAALLDAGVLEFPLAVGPPRPGDRIRPLGMSGRKKVGDLLTDEKVPERLRPLTPVVRSGDTVVWVAGVRVSEDAKVGPGTSRAVLLRWERGGGVE